MMQTIIKPGNSNNISLKILNEQQKETLPAEDLFNKVLEYFENNFSKSQEYLKIIQPSNSLLLIKNGILKSTLFYYLDLKKKAAEVIENPVRMDSIFFRALYKLMAINPIQILPTITGDESIYLRIYTNENQEIHLEVFADYDESDEGDVEAIVSLFNHNDDLLLNYSGTLEMAFEKLQQFLNKPDRFKVSTLTDIGWISSSESPAQPSTATTV